MASERPLPLLLATALLAADPTPSPLEASSATAIDAAFAYLNEQMDARHREVTVYREPAESSYLPSGAMGDPDLTIEAGYLQQPFEGRSSVRFTYRPSRKSSQGWAGVYFQYPERNWGECAGRDLRGASRLTFWARADHPTRAIFKSGGINRYPWHDPAKPFMDSYGPLSTGKVKLTREWQRFAIDLRDSDLSSVIGPLVWISELGDGFEERSVFVDDVVIDKASLDEPRFVQSYLSGSDIAHVYDQALVCLAYLARGRPDDLRRARLIADALVLAQAKDRTFHDGRLRNAYRSGELLDPCTHQPRLPGFWKPNEKRFLEDRYGAGSDTGNLAWAGLALVQADARLERSADRPYLAAARGLGRWIVANHRVDDALGGFSGGYEGFDQKPEKRTYRSTEHNLDLVALFRLLARSAPGGGVTGEGWAAQAEHAERFVQAMWNRSPQPLHLWTGTKPNGVEVNTAAIPLDVQAWSVLALEPRRHEAALEWALRHCRAGELPAALDFDCGDGDGAWWEGTAQAAAALVLLGRRADAAPLLSALRGAQIVGGPAAGGMPAASKDCLTTGFGWSYPHDAHIGATAWYVFAELGKNPFDLTGEASN